MTIPLPVIPGVYRVTWNWTALVAPTHAVNVMHFSGATGPLNIPLLAAKLNSTITSAMFDPLSVTAKVDHWSIIPLDGFSGSTDFAGPTTTGSSGGDTIPQVSILLKISTGLRGRNNRGRNFLPFVSELEVANGTFASTSLTPCQAAWRTWQTAMNTGTDSFALGVASYDRAHSGAGAHFTVANPITVESLTATQRRRQPGRKVARHR